MRFSFQRKRSMHLGVCFLIDTGFMFFLPYFLNVCKIIFLKITPFLFPLAKGVMA